MRKENRSPGRLFCRRAAKHRNDTCAYALAEAFDFQIFPSPESLEAASRAKVRQGGTARLVAGYCRDWSNPDADGTLIDEAVIGSWKKPWNARPTAGRLAKGIAPAALWATDPGGIDQVGCIDTAQGFEMDYVGVIWSNDLRYDLDQQSWVGNRLASRDRSVKQSKTDFVNLLKNTYRVLPSRGMKGCHVCFLDQDTSRFVRSRMDMLPERMVAEPRKPYRSS